jgi:hypothetical protein
MKLCIDCKYHFVDTVHAMVDFDRSACKLFYTVSPVDGAKSYRDCLSCRAAKNPEPDGHCGPDGKRWQQAEPEIRKSFWRWYRKYGRRH